MNDDVRPKPNAVDYDCVFQQLPSTDQCPKLSKMLNIQPSFTRSDKHLP
jgi:hypothetical protein